MEMRHSVAVLLVVAVCMPAAAQDLALPAAVHADPAALRRAMPVLAREVLDRYREPDRDARLNTVFRLQMVAGDRLAALTTLAELRALRHVRDPEFAPSEYTQYELFTRVGAEAAAGDPVAFARSVREQFGVLTASLSDKAAYRVGGSFVFSLAAAHWVKPE